MAASDDPPTKTGRERSRTAFAAVGSVGAHLVLLASLVPDATPRALPPVTSPSTWIEVAPPPPEPVAVPEPPPTAEADAPPRAARDAVASTEGGLRVDVEAPMPRLALRHVGDRRGPFDIVERLEVGRYAPRLPRASTRPSSGTEPTPDDVGASSRPPTPGTSLASASEPVEAPDAATSGGVTEASAVEPDDPSADTPVIAAPSAAPAARARTNLATLRTFGDLERTRHALHILGTDVLPLLGLTLDDVVLAANVRGGELARGRAVALSTGLAESALRERIEGAANGRGAPLTFGETPLPSSAVFESGGREFTLAIAGSNLVVGSRPTARLLNDALALVDGTAEDASAWVVAERAGSEIDLASPPARIRARLGRDEAGVARLDVALEFPSPDDAVAAMANPDVLDAAVRESLALPGELVAALPDASLTEATVYLGVVVPDDRIVALAARLARAD